MTTMAAVVAELDEDAEMSKYEVFQRIGHLTRKLHDALRELGYDRPIEEAVSSLPDARARLSYVATLTGQAADKVLSAVETGMKAQERMESEVQDLARVIREVEGAEGLPESARRAIGSANETLLRIPAHAEATRAQFTEIMVAQDFHDLTGQVIQKVVKVATGLEEQLLKLLLDVTPPEQRARADEGLAGPVINAEGREDVVTNQAQVDDLLESLGF